MDVSKLDKIYKAKNLPAGLKVVYDIGNACYYQNGRWHYLIKNGKAI